MRSLVFLLCLLCVSAVDVRAQAADPLKAFDFFVGGTWVAEGEFPGMGHYTAERTYRKILDGKFLEMEQVTNVGTYHSVVRGVSGWHPDEKKIVTWGFGDDGSIAISECECASAESFTFEGRLIGGTDPGPIRGRLRRTGPDSFTETIEAKQNGVWQSHGQFEFRRKPESMAPVNSPGTAAAVLEPLERLVGTWVENVKYTNASYKMELAFHWVLGGRFLMSEYRVSGTANAGRHAISFIGYDADQKHLVQYGFNVDGSVSVWQITASDDVPEMVFQGDLIGSQRRTLRVTYRRPDEDTLTSTTEFQYQGIFQPADNVTMRRTGP